MACGRRDAVSRYLRSTQAASRPLQRSMANRYKSNRIPFTRNPLTNRKQKMHRYLRVCMLGIAVALVVKATPVHAEDKEPAVPKAFIDGTGLGWKSLGEADFTPVNGAKDTWSFKDGIIHCTGKPHGVMRTQKQYTNFELVAQWQHL